MKEMEREKVVKELDVEDVDVSRARWEKDRKAIESELEKKKKEQKPKDGEDAVVGGEEGPVAHVGEEGVPTDEGNGLTGIEEEKSVERETIGKEVGA